MPAVSLAEIKEHVQAPLSGADDVKLTAFGAAAEGRVEGHLRRDMAVDFPDGWPEDIKQAVCMLVAHWYENRTGTSEDVASVPMGFFDVLSVHRDMS